MSEMVNSLGDVTKGPGVKHSKQVMDKLTVNTDTSGQA